ncbi:hypothetical protein [Nonomuraea guangzhouensis]|uniref:Uncharacterized protein n=1 Tax=Nonomuraea guangzhouensis TaxID=1291555 RepID=A0ABW4GWX2_9ACTN|nr:hypothetical protein [Nonomuraea guangzhouensis]
MALLNPPDILPEAMRFLVRALVALPKAEAEREELVSLVAPRGLAEAMDSMAIGAADPSEADPDDLRAGGSIIASASLDALRMLGMVEQSGNRIKLATAEVERWKVPADVTPRSMFQALLDAVITVADSDASSGVGDFVQTLVLLHTAGEPLRPFDRFESPATSRDGRSFAIRQEQVLGSERKGWLVPNREQWSSFRRWASYLGLARPVGSSGLIPDASEALACLLPTLAPGDYDVRDFAARCASAVPILDGRGLQFGHDPQYEGDHAILTGGLTVSLLQLEADGFLTMERRSDAGGRTLRLRPDGSADRIVTTVVWEKTRIRGDL